MSLRIDELPIRFTTSSTLTALGGYNFVLLPGQIPTMMSVKWILFFEGFTTHLFPKASQITHLSKNSRVER